MTVTPAALWGPLALGTSNAAIYTQVAGLGIVTEELFANVGALAVHLKVWVVRSGGSAGTANQIIGATATGFAISSGQSYVSPELANLVLGAGDAIWAVCDTAASLNTVGSGWTQ
jgi:hypothetical protein